MHQENQPLPAAVLAALQDKDTITAIKLLRELQGLGLNEAKIVIDLHLAGLPIQTGSRPTVDDSEMPLDVVLALREGRMIEAIKHLREARGLGLKEAKDAVDAYRARHPSVSPSVATVRRDGGRMGWLWLVMALLAGAASWAYLQP